MRVLLMFNFLISLYISSCKITQKEYYEKHIPYRALFHRMQHGCNITIYLLKLFQGYIYLYLIILNEKLILKQQRRVRFIPPPLPHFEYPEKIRKHLLVTYFSPPLTLIIRVCAQSRLILCSPMDCSLPISSSMEFRSQEYYSGLPFPITGDLPDSWIKPTSPALASRVFTIVPPRKLYLIIQFYISFYLTSLWRFPCLYNIQLNQIICI